ncbi:hypothetical protein ACIBEA_29900 [Streptomyces sp. NPDC051555]|uniref:DUF6197 family protein n=1 Tax=Streptomyces sp. NPDC051555 TaxID=3365657 RepID=UPI0037AD449F
MSATLIRRPPAKVPTLEERMALSGLAMDERLGAAGVEYDVRTAGIEIPEILTGPLLDPAPRPPASVAEVLRAAHQLMADRGWCQRWLANEDGAVCLLGAIRAAGGGSGHQDRAEEVLLRLVQQEFPDAATVSGWNDGQRDGRAPLRMLDQAARHADRHGY